jgi:hypothetical protein
MEHRLTESDARLSLLDHMREKALAARQKYGPNINAAAIALMLEDRAFLRYPLRIDFDAATLEPGEFACLLPLGIHPSDGFSLCIHPAYQDRSDVWPSVIAYYIPSINYGEIAGPTEAECFGATLLGTPVEDYYQALCTLADALAP